MKRTFVRRWMLALGLAIAACALLLPGLGQTATDPLQIQGQVAPPTLTSPGTVTVSLNILNISDITTPISVTLTDPANNTCASFGSGGTASLGPGKSASYTGSWTVTQAQLEAGKIIFNAKYSFVDENGTPVSASKPYSLAIKYNTAKPSLTVQRQIDPATAVAVKGQTVKISYILQNTGTVDATDIIIKDPGIFSGEVTHPLLKVGDKTELSYTFSAEDTSKTTQASITYSYKIGDKVETKTTDSNPQVISITTPKVSVTLEAEKTSAANGDTVKLTGKIINQGDLSYEKVKITDITLGDLDSGISIAAGKTHEFDRPITMGNSSQKYQLTVTATDSTGVAVSFQSNLVTITPPGGDTAEDPGVVPEIEVTLDADRQVIYSTPSDIIFVIGITNNGEAAVKNATLIASGKEFMKGINIEPGETVVIEKLFSASMAGQFQFIARVKVGNTNHDFESNIFPLTFQQTSTPPPPPQITAPPVTPNPETLATPPAEDEQNAGEQEAPGVGKILLYALAVLLGLVGMGIVLLFVLDRRRNRPSGAQPSGGHNMVIDSIQRSPHRDYARAPKRTPTKPAKEQKEAAASKKRTPQPEPEPSVYAPDDDEMFRDDFGRVPAEPAEGKKAETKHKGADAGSAYRRPAAMKKPADDEDGGFFGDDDEKGDLDMSSDLDDFPLIESSEEDSPLSRKYLSRIRGIGAEDTALGGDLDGDADKKDASFGDGKISEPKNTMSDEDAALLSGSTGQYRLSRNTATVVKKRQPEAEDAETFTRRQRASRTADRADQQTYYDDEDDVQTPHPARRRRG